MKDKLYIIGNGFDLHHKLKTTYFDFRNQCLTRSPRLHKYLTEAYGDNLDNEMWWYNFEEMLGKVDYLHLMSSDNGMAIGSLKVGQLQQNEIPSLFGKWICGIDCNIEADLTLDIDIEAQFFTFNYTMILENVYGIDKNNVWHIHNSVDDFKYNKPPIVGHDSCDGDLVMYLSEYRNSKYNVRPDIADNINREIAKGAKKVQNRINQNEEQFHKRYSNINHFVCMGFSFNNIDMPYIEKIIKVNKSISDTDWTVYWHSDQEDVRIQKLLFALGINQSQIQLVRW